MLLSEEVWTIKFYQKQNPFYFSCNSKASGFFLMYTTAVALFN